jgi:hypothetical protein
MKKSLTIFLNSHRPKTHIRTVTVRTDICERIPRPPHRLLCRIHPSRLLRSKRNLWTRNKKDNISRPCRQSFSRTRIRGLCTGNPGDCCRT